MGASDQVSVIVVNWNGGTSLADCLASVRRQTYTPIEAWVIDNASSDDSARSLHKEFPDVHWLFNNENRGWCGALNQGYARTSGRYVLTLNPDVVLAADFIAQLVSGMDALSAGSATGKLLRPMESRSVTLPYIDSTGLVLNRTRRPQDRGRGTADRGRWDEPGEVFGACGAAALHRREMLCDIAVGGAVWDETLFAYYDDVDLAWRAQWRGWRCAYVPTALAYHDRGSAETLRKRARSPADRQNQARAIANRYLVMLKNETWRTFLPDLPFIVASDLPRWLYITLRAPRLWTWLAYLRRGWRPTLAARREVQRRRTASHYALSRWLR